MTARALFVALPLAIALASAPSCSSGGGGPPPHLDRAALLDPQTCKQCHADHYREWSGSMHAYASDDPVFRAMNARGQRETGGQLGAFCVNCHAPMAVREKATTDGLNLDAVDPKLKGVGCFFCHSVSQVTGAHDDPLVLADDLAMRGPFADPVSNTAHAATYSSLHDRDSLDSATMCGACHDIRTGHGADIERTFAEWQASVFSHAPGGTTCGQCHMAQSPTLRPIAQAPGVFARRAHAHTFEAVDRALTPFAEEDDQKQRVQALLDSTLQSAVCVAQSGNFFSLRVILDNVAAGHSFPSGSAQDRRLWVEVVATQGGSVVYQSGAVPDGTSVTAMPDPDLWLMRDCMFDESGNEVHMFWQAASTEGNALPGQATFDMLDPRYYQTHVVRSFPLGGGVITGTPDQVTLRVRLQPMGLEVLDDLVASKDLDPAIRAAMPTYVVGAPLTWTPAAATDIYFEGNQPIKCVTTTNLNVKADKVAAVQHMKCKP